MLIANSSLRRVPIHIGAAKHSSLKKQLSSAATYCPLRVAPPLRGAEAPVRRRISAMSAHVGTKEELLSTPGVYRSPDAATKDFIFQQTMMRIKDPKRSLDFYTRVLGMTLICKLDFADAKFSLYFLGYHSADAIPEDPQERVEWMFKQPATVELTHNHGTEGDDTAYHSGNADPKGFGHIGIEVPDVYAACKRFDDLGVDFQKKPDAGSMKGLAFVKDPDGYWIEILNAKASRAFAK